MRNFSFGIITLLILTACGNGKSSVSDVDDNASDTTMVEDSLEVQEVTPEYDVIDAQGFGLKGKVKSIELLTISTYEDGTELKEGDVLFVGTIDFDKFGHILHDEWGNEYGYDADGKFYRGNHMYTSINRDKEGRIVKYEDEEPNRDNEANKTIVFKYDKVGRLSIVEQRGWSGNWTLKRNYKNGMNPDSETLSGTIEGGSDFSYLIKFNYQHFDNYDNWTERTVIKTGTLTGVEYDEDNNEIESTQPVEEIRIERRKIIYYE